MKKPELLAPAGDWPSLVAAVEAGADSVYFGIKKLNMRAGAKNFEIGEIKKIVDFCRKNKVKVYVTVNTIIYENELDDTKKILRQLKKDKVDAVIAWDMAVIAEAKKMKIPVHLSTQASVSNSEAALMYRGLGVERIILARECSLNQIKDIKKKLGKKIEIESFVHGAMCISVSGRCFLSQELFGKSANRGECIQPCRREYLVEDFEEPKKLRVGSHFILSPKDLCALPFIDRLAKAGIDAFKIEGRNRAPEYVKTVVEVYRDAIDNGFKKSQLKKLKTVYNRGFSSGFYLDIPSKKDFTDVYGSKATKRKKYVGFVKNFYKKPSAAEIKIEAEGIKSGDELLIIGNKTGVKEEKAVSMEIKHRKVKKANKGQSVAVKLDSLVRKNDKVYKLAPLQSS